MFKWTADTALAAFQQVFKNSYVSANVYDKKSAELNRISRNTLPGRSLLQSILRAKSWEDVIALTTSPDTPDPDISTSILLRQNKQLLSQLQSKEEVLQLFIENCASAIANLHIKPVNIPAKINSREDLEMHSMRSDDHCGAKVTSKSTQGLGAYDSALYKQRLNKWVEKILTFKYQDSTPLGLNKLVLYYLGDIVTGEAIYKGQTFALDLFLTEQLFYALELNVNAILGLAQTFNSIEIFCCQGNHGRPAEKGMNHYLTNFDYILYRMMQIMLKPQENVKVFVSESPGMVVRNGEYVFHLSHGEKVKSWAGIPYYGLDRQYRKLSNLYNMIINYQLTGHFHTPAQLSDCIIMNGSMVGGDELSINQMSQSSIPSQKIWYFDKHHGINRMSDLYLAEPVKLIADNDGIFTPHV